MTILPIRIWGDPVLHTRAHEVTEITDEIRTLVANMIETMKEAPGVGLAAPQVGEGLRIFVWNYEGGHQWDRRLPVEERPGPSHGVVINPDLELFDLPDREVDPATEMEGCLSLPGLQYPVLRYQKAVLTGTDVEGQPIRIEAVGWLARIFQHEYDHLNGTLYVQRLTGQWEERARAAMAEADFQGGHWVPGEEEEEPRPRIVRRLRDRARQLKRR
ncbi:MAG: peptide deformylase [Actinomycetaceae bacterium]|nr:peptide deformylase [Actinomycetaceae bacterium]